MYVQASLNSKRPTQIEKVKSGKTSSFPAPISKKSSPDFPHENGASEFCARFFLPSADCPTATADAVQIFEG